MTSDEIIQWLDRNKGTLARTSKNWYASYMVEVEPHVFNCLNGTGKTPAKAIAAAEADAIAEELPAPIDKSHRRT